MDDIKKVCHAYHVYFKAGPKDKSDDYIVSPSHERVVALQHFFLLSLSLSNLCASFYTQRRHEKQNELVFFKRKLLFSICFILG